MQSTQICIWSIKCHSKLFMNTRNAWTQRNETKAVVKSNTCRRSVWGGVIQGVRSHTDLLCNAILFVGLSVCVAEYQSLLWCDYCLLVALWFLFHIELAKSLPFRFRSSDLIPKFELQKTLRTRRKRSGAPHASLVYNRVVAWVVWKNLCFFVWYFVMTVMLAFASSVCRHSAHGMAKDLAHRQLSLYPHAIDCMAMGNASKGSRSPSLPTYKYAWRVMCVCNNYSS